jgi:hypothetical protein
MEKTKEVPTPKYKFKILIPYLNEIYFPKIDEDLKFDKLPGSN